MPVPSSLYKRTLAWSRHPRAPWCLGISSCAESSFSPIPPDVMPAPMCLAGPARAWRLTLLPFNPASLVGRGARFYLVAGLMAWGGARMEAALHRHVDRLGWAFVAPRAIGVLLSR